MQFIQNFMCMAGKDHLRNHGFLYDRNNQWRLSPAYDLNPVPRVEKARELTTWICDKGPEADLDIARAAASNFALTANQANTIFDEVVAALNDWRYTAKRFSMPAADITIYGTAIEYPA